MRPKNGGSLPVLPDASPRDPSLSISVHSPGSENSHRPLSPQGQVSLAGEDIPFSSGSVADGESRERASAIGLVDKVRTIQSLLTLGLL